MNGKVCIVQGVVKQYRYAFFVKLYERLKANGIRLQVLYSEPNANEAKKGDNVELPTEVGTKVRGRWFFSERFAHQSIWQETADADLVIVEQANKYVMSHLLVALSLLGRKRVAFWGHGRNRQGGARMSEWLKRRYLTAVDWWFAYTKGVAGYLEQEGVQRGRITTVMNSVDTVAFQQQLAAISVQEVDRLRTELGIGQDDLVGIYCGGLHPDKRLAFLLDTAKELARKLPAFHLVAIGSGVEAPIMLKASRDLPCLHYVGPKFGMERAAYFRMADAFLCPGLVGLAILDAFAAGLPVATTDIPIHSPEIEYLEDGVNGIVTKYDLSLYTDAVAALFLDAARLGAMQGAARTAASCYSIEFMVEIFSDGILACLGRS